MILTTSTYGLMITFGRIQPSLPITPLKIKQICMERVHSYKYLGVWLTCTLNWSIQVSEPLPLRLRSTARGAAGIVNYWFIISKTVTDTYLSQTRYSPTEQDYTKASSLLA